MLRNRAGWCRSFALALSIFLVAGAHAQTPDEGRGFVEQPSTPPLKKGGGLWIGGLISLGTLYLGNVTVAVVSGLAAASLPVIPSQTSSLGGLFVPLAGPFLALSNSRNHLPGTVVLLVLDGLAQLASATLVVWGLIAQNSEPGALSWQLLPGAAGAPVGARFLVRWP